MGGSVIFAFEERAISLGSSAASQEVIIADRVDLLHWNEVTFQLRVHTHTLGGHGNSILIGAYPMTVSEDDPGVEFLDVFQTIINLTSSTPIPAFFNVANLPSSPPLMRIVAMATRADSGTIGATISMDISVKDL